VFKRILIICVGNICRSPTAECLLKTRLEEHNLTISSAGLKACVGEEMDKHAHTVLDQHGYAFTHTARQLMPDHIRQADLILVMEKEHIESVLNLAPEARGRVFLLGKWQSDREIPDPYTLSQSTFEHTYTLIDEAVQAWIAKLGYRQHTSVTT